ncbi:MAG TPA: hypothetical protein VJT16_16130 [Streptosporangiaceae bacterium]|nr:hypothetical protein [Streptosporangiaceae bacterium]
MTIVLSRALVLLALDYERESPLSLPMSADILPAIGTDKVRLRDLPLRAGVSKEAVSAATGFLGRTGFAVRDPGPAVALTERGIAAMNAHDGLLLAAEARWAVPAQIERLRACVIRFANQQTTDGAAVLSLGLRPYPDGWRCAAGVSDGAAPRRVPGRFLRA